jgi:hypothetical protein
MDKSIHQILIASYNPRLKPWALLKPLINQTILMVYINNNKKCNLSHSFNKY